jgi:transcriptional regulator with XRE-family HTH domain
MKSADEMVLKSWGETVKARRKALGLTQVAAAERCRMSQPSLSKIEAGEYRLHPRVILQICDGLDLDPSHAFGWPPAIVEIARSRSAA